MDGQETTVPVSLPTVPMSMPITVAQLYRYPIKSCQGAPVSSIAIDEDGPIGDRTWMVVDERGDFVSQRTAPDMALIRPSLAQGLLRIAAPGMPELHCDADEPESTCVRRARIWKDTLDVTDQSEAANRWFSEVLQRPCRLVRLRRNHHRTRTKTGYAQAFNVRFADSTPWLLTSVSSLEDLNRRLDTSISMLRFRPNIVVQGAEAYDEDQWTSIVIGSIRFPALFACDRCTITTLDAHGSAGPEPLRTLAAYRQRDRKVYFGQRMVHNKVGVLRVGDELRVVSRGLGRSF